MKVALYARYSSDNQRDASITDQLRMCRLRAEKEGWTVVEEYTDHAISGASMILRPGVQSLISDSLRGRFDMIMAEAMDRLLAARDRRIDRIGLRPLDPEQGAATLRDLLHRDAAQVAVLSSTAMATGARIRVCNFFIATLLSWSQTRSLAACDWPAACRPPWPV